MRAGKTILVSVVFLVACSGTTYGYGWYNWYGGYATATATSWNGGTAVSWDYSPSWYGWGWGWWGTSCYARTYTNTYPGPDWDYDYGWHGAYAESHSSASGRTADAWAYAYNAGWGWWNRGGYARSVAQTSGSPSYATAYARAGSGWHYRYWVPRLWWYNTWVPTHGWYIPYYCHWYYWGWLDGDMTEADMALEVDLIAQSNYTQESQPLLQDGFIDDGDGTCTQLGSTLDPGDLVYNSNVGGTGHPGWDIIGHSGEIETDSPYELAFLMAAIETGGDVDYVELEVEFKIDGYIGQVPEPTTLVLLAVGGGLSLYRRRNRAA